MPRPAHRLQLKETRTIALTPTLEGAYSDMREYLNGRADSVRATAFFADNDAIAIGAIRALQEHGFHVPDDVSVIGVDDIPFSAINTPPLTTMRVSRSQLGHLTVDILTRRIKNPTKPRGQPHGAGAGDDQHRNGDAQGERETLVAEDIRMASKVCLSCGVRK